MFYLLHLMLLKTRLNCLEPSLIVSSGIILTKKLFNGEISVNEISQEMNIEKMRIEGVIKDIVDMLNLQSGTSLTASRRKFEKKQFYGVSKIQVNLVIKD